MKTVLYLIRHGQSVANELNKFAGYTDFPLSQFGLKQAQLSSEYFNDIKIDAVYSSDLSRAFSTVKVIADQKGLEVIPTKALREMHCGVWEGADFDTVITDYADAFEIWQNDIWKLKCENGESTAEVFERVDKEVRRIAEKHKGQTVILGAHALVIRVFCGQFVVKEMGSLQEVPWPTNASVTKLDYEDGKFNLLSYSYDEHIKDLLNYENNA